MELETPGAPRRRPRCPGDRGRAGRARRRAHARRRRERIDATAPQGGRPLPGGGRGPRPRPPAARAPRASRCRPDRIAPVPSIRLGWLGAQMDTMPMSESVAYQERALAEAGDTADVATAAHAVARAPPRHRRGLPRRAPPRRARGRGGVAGRGQPHVPVPLGRARHRALLRRGGPRRAALRGGDRSASRRPGASAEPYQSPRLQLGLALPLHRPAHAWRGPSCTSCSSSSVELGRVRSTAGCLLHLTELEVRAGNLAAGGGARAGVPPPRPPATRRPERRVVPERPRRDARSGGSTTRAASWCGRRGGARVRVDGLAGAPPRGARSSRARRRATSRPRARRSTR